ncbi:MAG: hypothetical protein IT496_12615 [Gammaproteobacteria bacterium]|nr:hypothetical protein [Gammaproteobacteria bacterium]MCG3144697.1 hypothetical protein [Gammaproteobacteria bacterium]
MQPRGDPPRRGSWYSQAVVWLGIAVFAASLAGSVWLIVLGARYDDARIPTGHQVFGVPAQQATRPPGP